MPNIVPGSTGNRYPTHIKESAVALIDYCNGDLTEVETILSETEYPVPYKTLSRWKNGSYLKHGSEEDVQQFKNAILERIERQAYKILGRIGDKDKLDASSGAQLAVQFGILIDKMRLLREQSTTINESRSVEDKREELSLRLNQLLDAEDATVLETEITTEQGSDRSQVSSIED